MLKDSQGCLQLGRQRAVRVTNPSSDDDEEVVDWFLVNDSFNKEDFTTGTPKFCIGFKIRKNNAGSGFGYSKGVKFCMHLDQLFFGSASAF